MSKILAISLATAVSAAVLAVPAASQIVVTPASEVEKMVKKVSRDLDRQLDRSADFRGLSGGNGITIVRFQTDEEGAPENVRIYRESGDGRLDRVAVHAVRNLRTLDEAPASIADDQVYQANIVFADNAWSMKKLNQQLAEEEAARIASSPAERLILALGSVPAGKPGS
ncbi:TonB family protein [Qipengyuania aquimaris]|uniref:TonB family protein n=1 Tax=Qipengyuania aquimaris TaxID=255984 RepID=UPI001C986899|nr:TonB family protein [Qipengyuania aquimaris]MBY6127549.1 TonB family protein [Qipengyuania aquimaris]